MDIRILYQDESLLACIKPAGLLSEEGGMPELLRRQCGGEIRCVHRLDKAASGVMLYARSRSAAAAVSEQIVSGKMKKTYLAIVQGRPEAERAELRDLLFHDRERNKTFVVKRLRRGVREAALRYTLLGETVIDGRRASLLRVLLLTGRTHQIRAQFASRAMPLYGDVCYGSVWRGPGLALWSECVSLEHPVDGRPCVFRCPPPDELPWNVFGAGVD